MSVKNEMEEGEISDISDIDEPLGQYRPLERPITAKAALPHNINKVYDDDYDSDEAPALPCDSDSDSDSGGSKPKAKHARGGVWGRRDALVVEDGGGDTFQKMAKAYQEDRNAKGLNGKRKNNIWGNFMQEESLNSEMSGVGVGKSLKDLHSDRGAETYDYTLIAKERREEERKKRGEEKDKEVSNLDAEMDSYWAKKADVDNLSGDEDDENHGNAEEMDIKDDITEKNEDKRGTKRSAKDRLGERKVKLDRYKFEVLPPPGKPRQIPDIAEENLIEGTDEEFGEELSERLKEEKVDMIIDLVKIVGRRDVWNFFKETQKIEASGGLEINNGARRRTAGGVMLHLLRKTEDPSIKDKVKKFFASSQKKDHLRKIAVSNKKKRNFEKEMEEFLQRRREIEEKKKGKDIEMEDDELKQDDERFSEEETELAPLPNILSLIANSFGEKKTSNEVTKSSVTRVSSFKEPDAPPNSVERVEAERALLDYEEDDFLSSTNETEDIELF